MQALKMLHSLHFYCKKIVNLLNYECKENANEINLQILQRTPY